MSLEKRTRPYEILIRINADGTIGAHFATISEVVDNEQVVAASAPELVSLGSVSGENADLLEKVLGEFSLSIASANEHLQKRVDELEAELYARSESENASS